MKLFVVVALVACMAGAASASPAPFLNLPGLDLLDTLLGNLSLDNGILSIVGVDGVTSTLSVQALLGNIPAYVQNVLSGSDGKSLLTSLNINDVIRCLINSSNESDGNKCTSTVLGQQLNRIQFQLLAGTIGDLVKSVLNVPTKAGAQKSWL